MSNKKKQEVKVQKISKDEVKKLVNNKQVFNVFELLIDNIEHLNDRIDELKKGK